MEKTAIDIACDFSDATDTEGALDAILSNVAPRLRGATDLAVVFFSPHHRERATHIASSILDTLAPETLLGCSAAGVAGNDRELEKGPGLSLFAASLPGAKLRTFTEKDLDWRGAEGNGDALRETLKGDDKDPRAVILLADPFIPLSRMLPAMSSALADSMDRPATPIIGGVASAATKAGENRLLINDTVRTGGLLGLTVSGDVRVDTVVSQGCRPVGKPFVVTKARHNLIESLGGRPALEALTELVREMDQRDRSLLEKGLFLGLVVNEYQERFGRGDFLIRNVMGLDQERGFIAVTDLLRVGQTVQFHVRDAQSASDDLEMMLAAQQIEEPPAGGLLFTCSGRGTNLFPRPNHDTQTIRRMLAELPLAGFFAAGEIGPVGNQSYIHGFTASMAIFRSR